MFGLDPTSRFALKLRRWRSRIGIAAPRVAVKSEVPLHWRVLSVLILVGCSLALAGWIYTSGLRFAGFHIESSAQELTELRNQVQQLRDELERTSKIADSSDSRLKIESTAHDRLATQIKSLEEENTRLKADLAMFENLAGNDQGPPGLEIARLQVMPEGERGQYRFRVLVAQKGASRDFKGSLQLVVRLVQGSQTAIMELPGKSGNPTQYLMSIRRFGRVEGLFRIPDGASIAHVEARLLENGVVKASNSVSL